MESGSWTSLDVAKSEKSYVDALCHLWRMVQGEKEIETVIPRKVIPKLPLSETFRANGRVQVQSYTEPTSMVNRFHLA